MQRNRYSKEFKVHEIIAATKGTASDVLLAFHAFPAEHWVHRRTTHPSESTFATLRHPAPPYHLQQEIRQPHDLPQPGLQTGGKSGEVQAADHHPPKSPGTLGRDMVGKGVAVVDSQPEAEQQQALPEEQRLAA